jgi:ribulose-phosphate 3-epimerase/protein sgcE
MFISPSLASADVLNLEQEARFAEKHFSHIHMDVEDGVYLHNITFGFKTVERICALTNAFVSLHLMMHNPAGWIREVSQCKADIVFVHVGHLPDPAGVLGAYRETGINAGLGLCDRDLENKHNLDYKPLFNAVSEILLLTARIDDPVQKYDPELHEYAKKLCTSHRVWVDGGVRGEQLPSLREIGVKGVVMGRSVFQDKERALLYKNMLYR